MTIKQLLAMPIGEKVGGFDLTIKTAKKKWQIGSKWMHQVLAMDETGEMLVDVNIAKNIPLQRAQTFWVIVSEIQDSEQGKKLYVDQFQLATVTEPDNVMDFGLAESERVIKSKVKCWLVAGCLQGGLLPTHIDKNEIDELVYYVMK